MISPSRISGGCCYSRKFTSQAYETTMRRRETVERGKAHLHTGGHCLRKIVIRTQFITNNQSTIPIKIG